MAPVSSARGSTPTGVRRATDDDVSSTGCNGVVLSTNPSRQAMVASARAALRRGAHRSIQNQVVSDEGATRVRGRVDLPMRFCAPAERGPALTAAIQQAPRIHSPPRGAQPKGVPTTEAPRSNPLNLRSAVRAGRWRRRRLLLLTGKECAARPGTKSPADCARSINPLETTRRTTVAW